MIAQVTMDLIDINLHTKQRIITSSVPGHFIKILLRLERTMIWLIKVAKSLTCYVQHSIVVKILVFTAIINFMLRLEFLIA